MCCNNDAWLLLKVQHHAFRPKREDQAVSVTYGKPYRTATYDRAVAALQALLKEEGPAQVYRACGDAVAYLERTIGSSTQAGPTDTQNDEPQRRKLLLSQEEAAEELGIGVSLFTQERNAGRIAVLRIGHRRLVPYAALQEYVKRRYEEQGFTLDEYATLVAPPIRSEPVRRTRGPNRPKNSI